MNRKVVDSCRGWWWGGCWLGWGTDDECLMLRDYLRLERDDYKWSESVLFERCGSLRNWDWEDWRLVDELRGI